MTDTSWLSKCLRWMFAIFSILAALAAVALFVLMLVDPTLPSGTHFGPYKVDLMGQPGSIAMQNSIFAVTALHGGVKLWVEQAGGAIDLLKHYGLPVLILNAVFYAVLFDLLRRLFRNVGRGESFTWQSVRLVQIVGVSLIVFSLVSAFAESWFIHAMYSYMAQHAVVSISGTQLRLPLPNGWAVHIGGHGFPFGTPVFFSGLLVLALSEVFRQGLVLKHESDLTV